MAWRPLQSDCEHPADGALVDFCHEWRATELALTLGTLLGENMTLVRLPALVLPRRQALESLRCASIALQFGHCCTFTRLECAGTTRVPFTLAAFRSYDHHHLPPLELGVLLDAAELGQILFDTLQHLRTEILVHHLPAA
jgi:hypothetical protein